MDPQKRHRLQRALAGSAVAATLAFAWPWLPGASRLEQATLDWRYRTFPAPRQASKRVVVLDIDERSLKLLAPSYGRWPWPRRVYKEMIEFVSIGQPAGILFDVLFTEEQQGTDDDRLLAEASGSVGVVSHAFQLLEDPAEERPGSLPLPPGFAAKYGMAPAASARELDRLRGGGRPFRDYQLPGVEYLSRVGWLHVVSAEKDPDGVFRRMNLAYSYGDAWLPALATQALRLLARYDGQQGGQGAVEVGIGIRDSHLYVGRWAIPLQAGRSAFLHYYPSEGEPETISFGALIASALELQKGEVADPATLKVNPLELAGKLVLVGASATGAADLKTTPIHSSWPGVLLHATAISNAIDGSHLRWAPAWLNALLALLGAAIAYFSVFFLEKPWLKGVLPASYAFALGALAVALFQKRDLALAMAAPGALSSLAILDAFAYLSFVEGRERRRLKGTLSKYLSPAVMESMIATGKDPQAEVGQRKELSILFSDIRGFTTFAEKFKPEVVVEILNRYLGRMTDVVFENQGTLDKFIGDAILAFWGAPLEEPDHALRALRCAFGMRAALIALRRDWSAQGVPAATLEVGIGINSGEVIVGNIGSEKRLDYTVIGDHVNLASRLEGLTKQYRVPLIVGDRTRELVGDRGIFRVADLVQVKGKKQHVKIYQPLALSEPGGEARQARELAERSDAAWAMYCTRRFGEALALYEGLARDLEGEGGLSAVYVERCKKFLAEPPADDWDGVFVARQK